jgi:phage terminase large subunit-like protein
MSPRRAAHRVDDYARSVLAGEIVAGPFVRLACARHERDRAEGAAKGFAFSAHAADHIIGFIERWVYLPDTLDKHGRSMPFLLQPWQVFIVGSLFGWLFTTGHRRYRNAFIEVGKGNGKTPLLAAIGLYGLMMDGQHAPEIYAAAVDRDQAMIMFRDAVRMVDASPELSKRIKKSGGEHVHNMSYGMGFFRPFSRDQGAKSGTRPHMGLIDEAHEHPSGEAMAKIRAGAKGNQDALFPEITNSGFDRASICWQHHEHSVRIVEQVIDDERWFSYVCALDPDDDPLTDTGCHVKANPNIGISIQPAYLADQVAAAQNIPAETNTVLRLNFCMWTQAHSPAWEMTKWREDGAGCDEVAPLDGRKCFGGLDLGLNDDFAAWARLWELRDGSLAIAMRFWIPRIAIVKYPSRPYAEWERAGLLTVTEGDTTDLDLIEETVIADARRNNVIEIAYDRRFASQLALHLQNAGLAVVDTPQGFALNESIKSFSKAIADGLVRHGGNRLLTWQMDNAVLRSGRNGEQRLDKDSSREKVDGPCAIVMANGRRITQPEPPSFQFFVIGGARA